MLFLEGPFREAKDIMMNRIRSLVMAVVVLMAAGGAYWYYRHAQSPIRPYEASRDRAFIIDLFNKNWYWLLSDYSPDYNVGFMLDHKAPTTKDMSEAGKLLIHTYLSDGKPAGFVTFYEDDLKIGRILFLGVSEEYRKKGYARELMEFAINELKKRGMLAIRMYTRTDNTRARKLYESLGFKEIWTDGAYLIYELIP